MESQDAVASSIAPDEACASAVKDAELLIDSARNPAGEEIVEDRPLPSTDGTDGTLVEVTGVVPRRTYRRLTDAEALILYQMLKRREREIQLQIEGGMADPLPTVGVSDPLPAPEVVNEARTPITLLKNAENVASFDSNHVIDIPSSLEMDAEEVAAVETPLTKEASYRDQCEEEVAARETPVTNKASSSQMFAEEASTRATHLTENPSSSKVYVNEASAGETNANHVIDIPSTPEMDVEEVAALETLVTNKASSSQVYAEEASTREAHLTENPSFSKVYLEEALTRETRLTHHPTSSKLYVEEGASSEIPMTKDASSSRAVRYNLRKRGPNTRKYKENEGSRFVGRRKIIKWSKREEATLKAGVKRCFETHYQTNCIWISYY
uniref:Uncharacterized protein n=1 Tax=Kalanchoe fedtschenkoi TaxID=63787 RepID=A0A7N0TG26_KALFE